MRISEIWDQIEGMAEVMFDKEMTTIVLNALPDEWSTFTSSIFKKK